MNSQRNATGVNNIPEQKIKNVKPRFQHLNLKIQNNKYPVGVKMLGQCKTWKII